jgi:alpha-tubulin suppressor-like RCC1 family protein
VSGGLKFQSISAGFETMCGVTEAGTGHCWGYNFGALGDGTSEHRSAPGTVTGGLEFHRISAGTGYSCGVTTAGSVYCWGDNSNGQLGNGTTVASETPVAVQWP